MLKHAQQMPIAKNTQNVSKAKNVSPDVIRMKNRMMNKMMVKNDLYILKYEKSFLLYFSLVLIFFQ